MSIEQIPTTWSDADEAFFRIVARVFSSGFVAGASMLLASYDDDQHLAVSAPPVAGRAAPRAPRADMAARTTTDTGV